MAVLEVQKLTDGRSGDFTENGQRVYPQKFRVLTDSRLTASNEVRFADVGGVRIPRLGELYDESNEFDLSARVRKVTARQTSEPLVWEVDVEYSAFPPNGVSGGAGGANGRGQGVGAGDGQTHVADPLLRPAVIERDSEIVMKPAEFDVNGAPIVNAAGDPFDPPHEVEKMIWVYTIRKNLLSWNDENCRDYENTVNDDTFLGWAAGTLWLSRISAVDAKETLTDVNGQSQEILYAAVTAVIKADSDGWQVKLLNKGVRELVGGVLRPIIDDRTHLPVTKPVFLNAAGAKWVSGTDPDADRILTFTVKDSAAFDEMNLLP